ncbi:hypothetical protein [Pseudomonas poae]|nr:hypothetical protein [Pseudomonas poae]
MINATHAIAESLDVLVESIRVITQEIPETQWAAGDITLA